MRIAITGSSGLVGSTLVAYLQTRGHDSICFTRNRDANNGRYWDPALGLLEPSDLEDVDAVVHLAGENIAGRRWSTAQKERIRSSRVAGTRLLAERIAQLTRPPHTLVSASAIGIYGSRGTELLDERSSAGGSFLAEVCAEWEQATVPAQAAGVRVAHARFGVVLSPRGGALSKMLLPFRLGLGGRVGSGEQWMSWVALDDAVRALEHLLLTPSVSGPANVVAPGVVTNAEFTRKLSSALRRPAFLPMPAVAARLAFGELADELLLASQRVRPTVLDDSGFRFALPNLDEALVHVLNSQTRSKTSAGQATPQAGQLNG